MKLEVNGVQYTNFISARCEIRLDAIASSFSFNAVNPDGSALPFKGGESCRVIVDGETVLTGTIEVVSVFYTPDEHVITISGRSNSAKLLDSTLAEFDDMSGEGLTLKSLIKAVADHIGLSIPITDLVNPPRFNVAEDLAAPEPGDNAFSFIEKYSRKRQVLLRPTPDGGIAIDTNSGIRADGAIQHIIGAEDNNVVSADFTYDITGRFFVYRIASQLSPAIKSFASGTNLAALVSQEGGALDTEIGRGRQFVIVSETSLSSEECAKRSTWEADVRKARGTAYSAEVPFYRVAGKTGALWQINRLYQITDDYVGKLEPMLCNSVLFSLSDEEGRSTRIGFVGPKAYTLSLEDSDNGESNVT